MVRYVVAAVLVAGALAAGCGGGDHRPAPAAAPTAAPRHQAPVAIYMFRVLGDDPLPDTITVRRDGSVVVARGGGHGGTRFDQVALSPHEKRKVLRLARTAPLHILAHNTITPGGFGGWDNTMRYLIRRNGKSVGVQQGDIPKPIRPLVRELDLIIENYRGRIVQSKMQSGVDLG